MLGEPPCYRAPELIKEHSKYTNKVDIFALGCILFELITGGKKAFAHDFIIREYSLSASKLNIPIVGMNVDSVSAVADLINNMLAKDASERPSARDLSIHFTKSRALSVGYVCHVMGDYKAAIKAYGWVTEVYKEDGSAWRRLGDSYRAANMDNEAIKAYRSAIAAGFTDSSIYIDMENLHAKRRFYSPIAINKIALQDDSRDTMLWSRINESRLSSGNSKKLCGRFRSRSKTPPKIKNYLKISSKCPSPLW